MSSMRCLRLTPPGGCLCSLSLLILVCTCEGGSMASRTWKKFFIDSSVFRMQTYSRLVTAPSRITCADLCSYTSACHVFYFRSDTGHCFLSPTLGKDNTTTSTPLTHVYYDGVTCPYNSDYQLFGLTSCMKLSAGTESIVAARQSCDADGGSIVTMKTVEKSTLLYNLFYKTTGIISMWLDASDAVQENHWVWADGDTFDRTHPLWRVTDPDGGTTQNCLATYDYSGIYYYVYIDTFCALTTTKRYVCEILIK